jgi:hypothetical protein
MTLLNRTEPTGVMRNGRMRLGQNRRRHKTIYAVQLDSRGEIYFRGLPRRRFSGVVQGRNAEFKN